MGFREHIERVVRETPGCVNCTLLGFDGISVDTVNAEDLASEVNVGDATVEYAIAVTQIRTAANGLESGAIEDVCIRSDKLATVLRPLTDEYLIAASFGPGALLGKGRYLMRLIAPKLCAELVA